MSVNHQAYKGHLQSPWGRLYYQLLFTQLETLKDQKILDFGSGFGLVASYLARHNHVIAIEPSAEMIAQRQQDFPYEQRQGSLDCLEDLPAASFDTIVCHNVLEYVPDPEAYLAAFSRLLKDGGRLSLVKHNQVGRILHTVVFENDSEKAQQLLAGKDCQTHSMGVARIYQLEQVIADLPLALLDYQGLRIFYGLQANEVKTEPGWAERMLAMETAVYDQSPYRDIAAFQHFWLKKNK